MRQARALCRRAGSPLRRRSPARFGSGDHWCQRLRPAKRPGTSRSWPARSARPGDLAARFARASRAARAAVEAASEHEAAIRDVAAGVAGPALVGFVLWIQEQARQRGLRRLRFLSRDGQVLYELTRRLAPGAGPRIRLQQPPDLELRRHAARPAGRGAVAVQQLHQVQRRGRVRPARPGVRAVPAGHAGLRRVPGP